ncbi:MAG: tetratricopeptide repeat protein [Pseudomonadota bacterium]
MTELNPRIPQYLAVAALSAASIGKPAEGMVLGEAAVLAAPDSHGAKIVRGISLVRGGDFERAASYLREAVLSDTPDDVTAMYYVGLAEHRLGNAPARDTMWDGVKAADDSDPKVQSLQGLIADHMEEA